MTRKYACDSGFIIVEKCERVGHERKKGVENTERKRKVSGRAKRDLARTYSFAKKTLGSTRTGRAIRCGTK
jgi:hypothetical protein